MPHPRSAIQTPVSYPVQRARITAKFNIHKDNAALYTMARNRFQLLYLPPRSTGRSTSGLSFPHIVPSRPLLPFLFRLAIQALSIGAIARSVSRPRGLSRRPAPIPDRHRLAFCDQRLTPRDIDATVTTFALVPAPLAISRRRCFICLFFFFP